LVIRSVKEYQKPAFGCERTGLLVIARKFADFAALGPVAFGGIKITSPSVDVDRDKNWPKSRPNAKNAGAEVCRKQRQAKTFASGEQT
jgi:hypothetical protein